jgi:arginine/ornithine N-succinyltransferase beta subunit
MEVKMTKREQAAPTEAVRKKKIMTCYLEPDQQDALRHIHRQTKIPMSTLIREGIDMMIELREQQLAKPRK